MHVIQYSPFSHDHLMLDVLIQGNNGDDGHGKRLKRMPIDANKKLLFEY